jgi:hypothetical protein
VFRSSWVLSHIDGGVKPISCGVGFLRELRKSICVNKHRSRLLAVGHYVLQVLLLGSQTHLKVIVSQGTAVYQYECLDERSLSRLLLFYSYPAANLVVSVKVMRHGHNKVQKCMCIHKLTELHPPIVESQPGEGHI